jgi:hypothetical protein
MNEYFCLCQGVDHETGVVEEELIGKIWLLWWFTYVFDPPNNRYLPNAVRRLRSKRAPSPDRSYCNPCLSDLFRAELPLLRKILRKPRTLCLPLHLQVLLQ